MFNMCELSSAFVQIKLKPIAYFLVFLTLRVHVLTYSHFMDTPVWFLAEKPVVFFLTGEEVRRRHRPWQVESQRPGSPTLHL